MKPATWADLEKFFRADGWTEVRRTGDIHYENHLPTGEVLRSSRSSGKFTTTIGRVLFAEMLRVQLGVDAATFWEIVLRGKPAPRPAPEQPVVAPQLPTWLARRLQRELGLRPDQLFGLTEAEATKRLEEFRSRPK